MKYLVFIILFQTNIHLLIAQSNQNSDYVSSKISKNYVSNPLVRTVQLYPSGDQTGLPLFFLGETNKLTLEFDDLSNEPNDYSYEIIHCTSNWEITDLMKMEYIEGVGEDFINDVEYSSAQFSQYVHYRLQFPNENMKLTRSGNYFIRVFQNSDPEDVVLVRRFLVLENKILIDANVRRSNSINSGSRKQEVFFTIFSDSYKISNPYQDLKVSVMQNGDWNLLNENISPVFVKGNEIEFLLEDGNDFNGMNEYRTLDLKSLFYQPGNVASIELKTPVKVDLYADKRRSSKGYEFLKDINGYAYIGNEAAFERSLNADYAQVQFSLSSNKLKQPVYVYGSMCNNTFTKESEMVYDSTYGVYFKSMLVKQGLHSYMYATENVLSQAPEFTFTEGNHWETENDYYILIYHKAFGDIHDRLIGFKELNSIFND